MAEVLGAVSGIAGLLSLTIEVSKLSTRYVRSVRSASESVLSLVHELKAFKQVLFDLDSLEDFDDDRLFDDGPARIHMQDFLDCKKALKELQEKLLHRLSGNHLTIKLKTLTWPFSEDKTQQIVVTLHRHLQKVQAAVNIDTYTVATSTFKEVKELRHERKGEHFENVLAWLSSTNIHQRQGDIFSKRQGQTGKWFLETKQVQTWLESTSAHSALWCLGPPGSGKTVMMSLVVDHINSQHRSSSTGVAFYYCDYKDPQRQTASDILAVLAQQLAASRGTLAPELEKLYKELDKENRRPTQTQMSSLLRSMCITYNQTFLLVDALDECNVDERQALISDLLALRGFGAKLLFTSRPNPEDLKTKLHNVPQIEIKAIESDIRSYVAEKLEDNEQFRRRLRGTTCSVKDIIDTIGKSTDGMFLMAVLQLNQIETERTATRVMKALKRMPSGLQHTYDMTIDRIRSQAKPDIELAFRVLQWLAYAKRPVLVEELQQALAVEWDEDEEPPRALDLDNVLDASSLLDVCAGLATIDEESNIIRLVHYTTQEYIVKFCRKLFASAHLDISRTCLAFISFDEFGDGFSRSDIQFHRRLDRYPFFSYVARYWGHHLRGHPEEDLRELTSSFLNDDSRVSSCGQVLHVSDVPHEGYSQNFPRRLHGLHLAATFGLEVTTSSLLQSTSDSDPRDSFDRCALHYAAKEGQASVIQLLLSKGCHIDVRDKNGKSSLQYAAENGHVEVVRCLAEAGALLGARDTWGHTALHQACKWGHETVVRLLLQKGASMELESFRGARPLHFTAATGQSEIARILLEEGADVDARNAKGWTPLIVAAYRGHSTVSQILLDAGGTVDKRTTDHEKTALHWAAELGQDKAVSTLIRSGASVHLLDMFGETALHYAAENGHQKTVDFLLNHNAPLETLDSHGRTPLDCAEDQETICKMLRKHVDRDVQAETSGSQMRLAAVMGDAAMLQSILDKDEISTSPVDAQKDTALHLAALEGHYNIVEMLITKRFSVNARGESGCTPLHRAANQGHALIVRHLLENGADLKAANKTRRTPLLCAALNGHTDVMKVFVEDWHVNVNNHTADMTLLWGASKYGHSAMVQLLLDLGAHIDALHPVFEKPALTAACHRGHLDTVRILLEAGADVDIQDASGKTPLHHAARDGHSEIVKLLLDKKANRDLVDHEDETAWDFAERYGHRRVKNLLSRIRIASPERRRTISVVSSHSMTGSGSPRPYSYIRGGTVWKVKDVARVHKLVNERSKVYLLQVLGLAKKTYLEVCT